MPSWKTTLFVALLFGLTVYGLGWLNILVTG